MTKLKDSDARAVEIGESNSIFTQELSDANETIELLTLDKEQLLMDLEIAEEKNRALTDGIQLDSGIGAPLSRPAESDDALSEDNQRLRLALHRLNEESKSEIRSLNERVVELTRSTAALEGALLAQQEAELRADIAEKLVEDLQDRLTDFEENEKLVEKLTMEEEMMKQTIVQLTQDIGVMEASQEIDQELDARQRQEIRALQDDLDRSDARVREMDASLVKLSDALMVANKSRDDMALVVSRLRDEVEALKGAAEHEGHITAEMLSSPGRHFSGSFGNMLQLSLCVTNAELRWGCLTSNDYVQRLPWDALPPGASEDGAWLLRNRDLVISAELCASTFAQCYSAVLLGLKMANNENKTHGQALMRVMEGLLGTLNCIACCWCELGCALDMVRGEENNATAPDNLGNVRMIFSSLLSQLQRLYRDPAAYVRQHAELHQLLGGSDLSESSLFIAMATTMSDDLKAISGVLTPTMVADIDGADLFSVNVRLQLQLHRAYFLLGVVEQALEKPFAEFVSPEAKVSWERLEIGASKMKVLRIMRMSGGWSSHLTGHSNGDASLFECLNDFVSVSGALDDVEDVFQKLLSVLIGQEQIGVRTDHTSESDRAALARFDKEIELLSSKLASIQGVAAEGPAFLHSDLVATFFFAACGGGKSITSTTAPKSVLLPSNLAFELGVYDMFSSPMGECMSDSAIFECPNIVRVRLARQASAEEISSFLRGILSEETSDKRCRSELEDAKKSIVSLRSQISAFKRRVTEAEGLLSASNTRETSLNNQVVELKISAEKGKKAIDEVKMLSEALEVLEQRQESGSHSTASANNARGKGAGPQTSSIAVIQAGSERSKSADAGSDTRHTLSHDYSACARSLLLAGTAWRDVALKRLGTHLAAIPPSNLPRSDSVLSTNLAEAKMKYKKLRLLRASTEVIPLRGGSPGSAFTSRTYSRLSRMRQLKQHE